MKRVSFAVGICVVASFLQGCVSPTEQVRNAEAQRFQGRGAPLNLAAIPTAQEKITVEKIREVQRFYELHQQTYLKWRTSAFTAGFRCVIVNGVCSVTIAVFQGTDTNTNLNYCIGLAPEFVIIEGVGHVKRIRWNLQLIDATNGNPLDIALDTKPLGSTLDFLSEDQGILVFKNIYDNGRRPQLKEGKRGIDPSNGNDKTKFHMKNQHAVNGTGAYLPIIVHTEVVDGVEKVALCGTPDPVIYNVN